MGGQVDRREGGEGCVFLDVKLTFYISSMG